MDNALMTQNFAKMECFLPELQKCILTVGFTYVMPYWQQRYFVIDIQQLITPLKDNILKQNLVTFSAIY